MAQICVIICSGFFQAFSLAVDIKKLKKLLLLLQR
jgi:hypothetical protein